MHLPLNTVPLAASSEVDLRSPPSAYATPREYLTWVLDVLQKYALNRARVDWPTERAEAFASIENATGTADTYGAIDDVIAALGDRHTSFRRPGKSPSPGTGGGSPAETGMPTDFEERRVEGRSIGPDIGYLALPGIVLAPSGYAAHGAGVLREIDRSAPVAWIVDLRDNGGGAVYPMLDVVAPLLGDGLLGAQVYLDGPRQEIHLRRGVLTVGGQIIPKDLPPEPGFAGIPDYVTHNDYVPHHPLPPVAVLTGEWTASAAEAVLTAFLGRPRTRTFGEKTNGLVTGNVDIELGDGAVLVLTMATTEDRLGRRYDNTPIPPDVLVDFNNEFEITGDPVDDPVVRVAVQWLREQG